MVETQHFDLVVIGTGPGGEGAAMRAAKAGKSVAAVERYAEVGGGCTHWAHDSQQGPAAGDLSHELVQPEPDLQADRTCNRSSRFPSCWPRPTR